MQRRNVSGRLLGAAVVLFLPLQAAAQVDDAFLEEPIQEYNEEQAQFDEGPPEPDWITSFRLGIGVNSQGDTGVLTTLPFIDEQGMSWPRGIRRGGGVTPIEATQGNPIDGTTLTGGVEIMGPTIDSALGGPRPFFVLDYRDQLEGYSTVVRQQSGPPGTDLDPTPRIRRIRTKGNVDQRYWLSAGLGAAFQLPIEGYNVKIKPSLNYFHSKTLIQGELAQPVLVLNVDDQNFTRREVEEVSNHGIAPRIELDAEVYREGPISVGFFLALDFIVILAGPLDHIVDTRGCRFDGPDCSNVDDPSNIAPHDGTPGYGTSGTLRFLLRRDRVTYQGTAGVRFSWMGGF